MRMRRYSVCSIGNNRIVYGIVYDIVYEERMADVPSFFVTNHSMECRMSLSELDVAERD